MDIPVSEAKGQLAELVRRAEDGEPVVLTRHGRAVVQLVPVLAKTDAAARRELLNAVRQKAKRGAHPTTDAARSQDFLYDDKGLPL